MDAVFNRAVASHNERIENDAQRFFRHAGAVVRDLDLDFCLSVVRAIHDGSGKIDAAARRQAGDFIFEQQFKQAAELRLVHLQRRQRNGNQVQYNSLTINDTVYPVNTIYPFQQAWTLEEIDTELFRELDRFAEDVPFGDDRTVVLVRRRG